MYSEKTYGKDGKVTKTKTYNKQGKAESITKRLNDEYIKKVVLLPLDGCFITGETEMNCNEIKIKQSLATALIDASKYGSIDIVKKLISMIDSQDDFSEALCGAAEYGHDKIVKLLLKHVDENYMDGRALRCAVYGMHWKCMKLLCNTKSLSASKDMLFHAARYNKLDLLKKAIKEIQAQAKNEGSATQ